MNAGVQRSASQKIPKIAIVGSGPAGLYLAEKLLKLVEPVELDVIERLPTPYGLIRSGVAPDHWTTKNVVRKLEQAFQNPATRFIGNVELGRDVSLAQLRDFYDVVVLATGTPLDRPLGLPGDGLPGVTGAARFCSWYNAHPDFTELDIDLPKVETAVVIGNGNVALDAARMLVRTPEELAATDAPRPVREVLARTNVRKVVIAGRRGAAHVKFSPAELREFSELAQAVPVVDPAELPPEGTEPKRTMEILGRLAAIEPDPAKPARIEFLFRARPAAVLGDGHVSGVRFVRTRLEGDRAVDTDEVLEVPAQLVVTCIGYQGPTLEQLEVDGGRFRNDDGLIAEGLYAAGWAARGPTGTIATNKSEAYRSADRIAAELAPQGRPGRAALLPLLKAAGVDLVDFDAWRRIDEAEVAAAEHPAPREKFTTTEELLSAAKS
ncbi:FAD-dependent oxidoreductase [Marinibaculum pumilum]|uniref:FAD-dependent oxidoreductase n=1 Tax=Marinibaculum pumilum TaxID=1766165 RepID=A0ABV7KX97_9PROT